MIGDLAVPPGNITEGKKKEGDHLSAFFTVQLYFALI